MTRLEQAIKAVENGLLPAVRVKGHRQKPMKLNERMARYKVPGFSIVLIQGDEIIWTQGYGLVEAGGEEPVTKETLFQAASISKPITAVAVMHLVERGVLDLDIDANELLRSWKIPENEFTGEQKVTLRRLLTHTAGLSVFGYRGYPASDEVPTVLQVLDGLPPANCEPVRVFQEPGKGFSYSGGGYTVIQQLLEDVTGKPFADLMKELIFDKLGMENSTFTQPLPESLSGMVATAHWTNGKAINGRWHTYPELAAAGLWSTPTDLARFVVEILRSEADESNAILSFKTTREMLIPPSKSWAGLGLPIYEVEGFKRFEHPGWNEGFHSLMCGYVGRGQGVVWMTNGENGKLLGQEVIRGLAKAYGWPGFEPQVREVAQVDPTVYGRFQGSYRFEKGNDWGGDVLQEGDCLYWMDTPDGLRFELFPVSETSYFALERPEEFTFVDDEDSKIKTVKVGPYLRLERME